ncbi:MAG: thiol:disulfide interchange protein [Novosphingobium lindaniclasticum]|jgi:DsbC/DsbD-like thiol-disulfide interchange protein/cytochrome c biogenesis protein CcdA|uniref:protein-disulfide reductase DsbD family protein n=1 Tax=Novosphingobium lindaniclasticum TaxID=1329895 RepID=UPI00240A8D72|nr:protein-disulfide reductase DsbD domain-containing protein [Novosphingobium lindaniclasticum]MDF2640244.1 thiol:disulfide interchange protein [Novosphingobium lindaniclasticum]
MEKRRYRLFMALMCQLLALVLAPAGATAQVGRGAPHVAAELVAGPATRPGGETTIAIHMTPEKGWHGYWSNPGDAGLGMQLDWTLPEGAKAGTPRYPVPQTLVVSGLMNHVYESDYAVLVPFTVPADAAPGTRVPVHLRAQWLACTEQICVPEHADLAVEVPVAATAATDRDPRFAEWQRRLPAPLDAVGTFSLDDRTVRLAIPLPATTPLDAPHVFVGEDKLIDYAGAQQFAWKGDMLIVTLPRVKLDPRGSDSLTGVLRLNGAGDGIAFSAGPGTVPAGATPIADDGTAPELPSLPLLVLAALAGGLLLNIMPCVFPILSLKALSLARAGESESHARIEGLAYAAGVILACLILGGVLLALRAGGEQVGWAFQLQEPLVVVGLLFLASAITANLLGLFEFAVPGFAAGNSPSSFTRGAFATGLLAAFVATPCTGPFMASAMGAALLLPVVPAMSLFAALGLGIALPFLAVAFVPALRKRLPRPGRWMVIFRHWMALPMGLTALALAWLTWKVGGTGFALVALAGLLLVLSALLVAGMAQRRGKSAAPAALIAAAFAVLALVLLPKQTPPAASTGSLLAAKPFSEKALAKARATGKPVFVWMTADWCLTCKVNEQVAIEREDTRAAFEKAGVVVLRGDWTRRDPEITRYLTAQGAAGVPLYVWYAGGSGKAQQLPQVLTPELLAGKAGV